MCLSMWVFSRVFSLGMLHHRSCGDWLLGGEGNVPSLRHNSNYGTNSLRKLSQCLEFCYCSHGRKVTVYIFMLSKSLSLYRCAGICLLIAYIHFTVQSRIAVPPELIHLVLVVFYSQMVSTRNRGMWGFPHAILLWIVFKLSGLCVKKKSFISVQWDMFMGALETLIVIWCIQINVISVKLKQIWFSPHF